MKSYIVSAVLFIFLLNISIDSDAQSDDRQYELIPEKSVITWVAKNEATKFTGTIKIKNGYLNFNQEMLSEAVVFANCKSITCTDCGKTETAKKLTDFIRSSEFLNVDNMDYAVFKMNKATVIENSKDGNFRLDGELTIIGYSNVISINVTISEKKDHVYVEGKLSLNRALWHLNNPSDEDQKSAIEQTIDLYLNLEGELK